MRTQLAERIEELMLPLGDPLIWSKPLFCNIAGETPTKEAVVAGWTSLIQIGGPAPRGHSARWSGANDGLELDGRQPQSSS